MGEPTTFSKLNMHYLTANEPKMHWLDKPTSFNSGMAHGNLGYQMQYSVESLEAQLVAEGNPHVLQLNAYAYDDDWKNPTSWRLYADGYQVASGDGKYAKQCFQASAEAFRDACRLAVEEAELAPLSERDYRLLAAARRIARFESFDDGSCAMGKRVGRAY